MPKWLMEAFKHDSQHSLEILAIRLAAAMLLGCVVAGIYRATHGKSDRQSLSLMATLVMLSILIAMVTLVIGENQARAFSLVGSLAIIRFRTVVEDTRDTAFVIFAVAVGMAAGAGYLTVTLLGTPFLALAAFLFRPGPKKKDDSFDHELTLRIGIGRDPEAVFRELLDKHLLRYSLKSTATAQKGAALELTYTVNLHQPDAAIALVAELNAMEGVQGVELRQR